MDFQVDTAEIRKAAAEIKAIADDVRQLSQNNVARMQNSVEEKLEGDTADAIMEVLQTLSADIGKIGSGLNSIQKELLKYIERIEEADRAASDIIEG